MRIWKCPKCSRTYDLAIIVPQLQGRVGRLLTDAELDEVPLGKWHRCPEPEEPQVKAPLTEYDWRTHGK